jgi:hypothetical protein
MALPPLKVRHAQLDDWDEAYALSRYLDLLKNLEKL